MTADQRKSGGSNHLAGEKSPYLLQHADNPVDWYPWGEEAFAKARREDKPVFLSIGYSTCHWCHVMEHESFEDSTVAALMNDAFVSIKVDREERPDIDNIYMTVCQMMTGSGGWPMTIVMTPDRKPFFAATYIPREDAYGRMGMLSLIPALKEAWATKRKEIDDSSDKIIDHLRKYVEAGTSGKDPSKDALELAHEQLRQRFDPVHGGFGNAPKFPAPHNLLFLLRYWKRSGDAATMDMVTKTLDAMAAGGMYDHIGFGFHRYSTDTRWFAPHFEKMLYDQALLAVAYTEAFVATGETRYRRIAEETLEYVLRDMTDERGGFYSAEDADSEGIEGKFYLWTVDEVRALLGTEDADLIIDVYGLQADGNFSQEVTAGNILYLRRPIAAYAAEKGVDEALLRKRLERTRKVLYEERETRIHPYKDDKVLTDWNGLMIAALARAGAVLGNERYTQAAKRAATFAFDTLRDEKGRLLHRYRGGEAGIAAHVDDYAFFVWGLVELYEATFDTVYLERALELNGTMLELFADDDGGGLYFSAQDAERLIVRMKEGTDGAIPSGNSVAMLNLIRLGRLTGETTLEDRARAIGRAFGEGIAQNPTAFTFMLLAVDFEVGPSYEVVIVGKPAGADTDAMVRALRDMYVPNKVVLLKPAGEKSSTLSEIAGFTKAHKAVGGKATAYVCQNFACELPTADIATMMQSLGADAP